MVDEKLCDRLAVLVRHKPHRDLGMCDRRKHCLGTFANITAPDAVYIKTRPDAGTFKGRIPFLSLHILYLQE